MAVAFPTIGAWYRRPNGTLFEVVAVDTDDATVEVQYFDGTIDEIDVENWPSLLLEAVRGPEDWTGAVDIDPVDYTRDDTSEMPSGYHDPLAFLDNVK
jgi:hypothetical protein